MLLTLGDLCIKGLLPYSGIPGTLTCVLQLSQMALNHTDEKCVLVLSTTPSQMGRALQLGLVFADSESL